MQKVGRRLELFSYPGAGIASRAPLPPLGDNSAFVGHLSRVRKSCEGLELGRNRTPDPSLSSRVTSPQPSYFWREADNFCFLEGF